MDFKHVLPFQQEGLASVDANKKCRLFLLNLAIEENRGRNLLSMDKKDHVQRFLCINRGKVDYCIKTTRLHRALSFLPGLNVRLILLRMGSTEASVTLSLSPNSYFLPDLLPIRVFSDLLK
jgi:hypothetical protein